MKKHKLLRNYKLKAMALVLAMLSWVIVSRITNNDKDIPNVPVQVTLPEGWAIRDKDVNTVQVTFRGSSVDLGLIGSTSVQVSIDLRDEEFEPEKNILITPKMVTFAGVNSRVTSIQPNVIQLQLGREGRKKLPVIVNQSGQPPEGFKVEAIEIEPPLVTLVGAEDVLEQISALQTSPLNLSDKIQSFTQRLDVQLPNPEWVGELEPPRVLVRVTLAGSSIEREFTGVPLLVTHFADESNTARRIVEPKTVDVYLKGSPQLLEELDIRRIQAFVSSQNLDNREGNIRKVNVLVPPGLEVLGIQPDWVTLNVIPALPTPVPTPTPSPLPVPPQPAVSTQATPIP